MTRDVDVDPVLQKDETVSVTIDEAEDYHFRAGVTVEDGVVTVSPVPERVGVETIGCVVDLTTQTAEDGAYKWGNHYITDFGTQIVNFVPVEGGETA